MKPKEKAFNKIKYELNKDINEVIQLAKASGLGELFFYFHYLHCCRVIQTRGDIPPKEKRFIEINVHQAEEAFIYLIQSIYKHGKKCFIQNEFDNLLINPEITKILTKYVLQINNKYESQYFLSLFENVHVFGKRDQHVKIDLRELGSNVRTRKFSDYALRVDIDNDRKKADIKTQADYLSYFSTEYEDYQDLFVKEFGVSLGTFIRLINYILDTITKNIKSNEHNFVKRDDGCINVQNYGTIMMFSFCLLIEENLLFKEFGEEIRKTLNKLIFDADKFDDHQLRYNLSARQPLFKIDEKFLVSPELLLDSLPVNAHYSLLESESVRDEYKKRYSEIFVNKLAQAAKGYGYTNIAQGLQLFEKGKQIGDLDLVLKNSHDHFILIEAKSHALPLDVYFHDFDATEKRLNYLHDAWLNKVIKRDKHLKEHCRRYNIDKNFTYIIVSRFPEILSHFSDYLVLTPYEFEQWLGNQKHFQCFDRLFDSLYEPYKSNLSEEQILQMQRDLLSSWQFQKE